MIGTFSRRKMVKKSEHWWKHGKHRPILGYLCEQRRIKFSRPQQWFATIQEAMASLRKR